MTTTFNDATTGWSFVALTSGAGNKPPVGGLALQNVQHHLHNFAKDIRLVGFWLDLETVKPPNTVLKTEKKFFVLSDEDFQVSDLQELAPKQPTQPAPKSIFKMLKDSADEALNFKSYFADTTGNYFGYGVRADYMAPSFFSPWSNCEFEGLNINQIFLFARFSNTPAHEPGGVLTAARFHPMVKFEFIPNKKVDLTREFVRVKSIRFDYRLHLYIDKLHDKPASFGELQPNNAALFRDSESAKIGAAARVVFQDFHEAASRAVFEAAEKPLVLEVVAPGLDKGFPSYTEGKNDVKCWDNIHWWGTRDPGEPQLSTPGGFHAAHLHWRWGAGVSIAPHGHESQFGPGSVPPVIRKHPAYGGKWGPLLDPKIWVQTIRIAIVKNHPELDPTRSGVQLKDLSKPDFYDLFTKRSRDPNDIEKGADLVAWYSAEVHRDVVWWDPKGGTFETAPIVGTVFIHGIFFPHEAEPASPPLTAGTQKPLHWPADAATIRKEKRWFRSG